MSAANDDIQARIIRLLQAYNKDDVPLTPDTRISADLNIDSADVLNFVMEVEDEFDIDIAVNELADIHTIADLTALVADRLDAGA